MTMPGSLLLRTPLRRRSAILLFVAVVFFLTCDHGFMFRRSRLPPGFPENRQPFPKPQFRPGVPKPPGSNYSRTLVVPRLKKEDVSWIQKEVPDLQTAIYVVDDPKAPLHPPKNKGHEVMVYLTYIIDHYDDLPDIMLFMHSHRMAWHNEEPLDLDAVQLLRRLSSERVMREGFMNLRCNWGPGCPDWIHPSSTKEDPSKPEEQMTPRAWSELFPFEPLPEVLAQPCCAQFALSRDRVLSIPKSRYIYYRDWLLLTDLSDYISGRIWEYLWQVVFTGESVFCPLQSACYCDGYGVCFGGEEGWKAYHDLYYYIHGLSVELDAWKAKARAIEAAITEGRTEDLEKLEVPQPGRDVELDQEIHEKIDLLYNTKLEALERGKSPEQRAKEAGRPWKEGDGF